MSRIALVRITEIDDGAVTALADSFADAARGKGHEVLEVKTEFSHTCHCGGHCRQAGGEGCGNEDCVCTFAQSVPSCDAIVFAFAIEGRFTPTALNRVVHKVTFDCSRSDDFERKKVFMIATSDRFEDIIFLDSESVINLECELKNWVFGGKLLVPGLPDMCMGADPVSRRKAAELVDLL